MQVALLLISPHVKELPNLDDITGVWCDNRIVSPKEKYYIDKAKALEYKKKLELKCENSDLNGGDE